MIAAAVRGVGQLLITAGLVILLFVGYELYGTGIQTAKDQHRLLTQLQTGWDALPHSGVQAATAKPGQPLPAVPLGSGVAILRVPHFGKDWEKVVVEGVTLDDLAEGPGHYPGTALPGAVGNFAVAGHRTTHGAPFNRMDELAVGDPVVVETRDMWFTYTVTGEQVVDPTATGVVLPVPDRRGATPTQKVLTFTTCNPKYSASQRLVVHGLLATSTPKGPGVLPPALLAEGLAPAGTG